MAASKLGFASQVSDWVKDLKGGVEGVFKEATQRVIDEMEKVGPSKAATRYAISIGAGLGKSGRKSKKAYGPVKAAGEGGHMPVDTGFLRASLLASTSTMPEIRKDNTNPKRTKRAYNPEQVNLVINNVKMGQTVYAGYTAAYAAAVNYGFTGEGEDGKKVSFTGYLFVEQAAQKWVQIVKEVEAELGSRLKS